MTEGWSRQRLASAISAWLSLSVLLVLIFGTVPIWGNESLTEIVISSLILSMMVVAWQTFMGNSGIISFGHVAFFAVGAYLSALLTIPPELKEVALPSLPPMLQQVQLGLIPTVVAVAGAAGALAFAIGLAFTRMQPNAMGIATFALLVMMHTLITSWEEVTRGGKGLYGVPRNVTLTTALIGLVLVVGAALLFKASPTGLRLQSTRDDPLAAESLGIKLVQVRLTGWVLSAILMGAGGSLWAQNVLAFGPHSFFFRDTFNMIAMLIVGGQASVTGAVAGCAVVTVISELMRYPERGMIIGSIQIPELPGAVQLAVALLILATLVLRPSGMLGRTELAFPVWRWLSIFKKRVLT